ncbi:hypothetical protein [Methylobacterium sp. CM6246]
MSRPATRLDLQTPFLDMSGAIHDLAALSAISVTVMDNHIKNIPEAWTAAGMKPQDGYIVVVLTEEQYRSVHFISEHIRSIAQTACQSLEAVENLIAEAAR